VFRGDKITTKKWDTEKHSDIPNAISMFLAITNREGGTVGRIPVIDYALLAKDYYEEEYNRTMTDQDFLDREDDYVLTFFLDEDHRWISSYILIHSWRVVTSNVEVE